MRTLSPALRRLLDVFTRDEVKAQLQARSAVIMAKVPDIEFWLLTKEEQLELMKIFNAVSEIERQEEREAVPA